MVRPITVIAFGLSSLLAIAGVASATTGCTAPTVDSFEGKGNVLPEKKKSGSSPRSSSHSSAGDAGTGESRRRGTSGDAGPTNGDGGGRAGTTDSGTTQPPTTTTKDPDVCFHECVAKDSAAAAYVRCSELNQCSIPSFCDDECFFDHCTGQEQSCDQRVRQCDQDCPLP